jgi:hypothetical protein
MTVDDVTLVARVLPTAEPIARYRESGTINADHLLFAIMSDTTSTWARILDERGVGSYDAVRKVSAPLPSRATLGVSEVQPAHYAKPMRRVIIDLILGVLVLMLSGLRRRRTSTPNAPALPLRQDTLLVIDVARQLAANAEITAGHVLVALASVPGPQIKLLRREHQVIAAAARHELGLERGRDHMLLLLHEPVLAVRRLERRLREAGGITRTLIRWALRVCGVLWALTIFFLETTATLGLYIFLWPALLLTNGVRALVARLLRLNFTVRRAHEIPGGELEVCAPPGVSDLRIAGMLLIPRAACFAVCVSTMILLLWQTQRLGGVAFPVTFARYDIIQGHVIVAQLVGPTLVLFDSFISHGPIVGCGMLAGIGCGVLALPSFREVQMIRLVGGHDVARGSKALRVAIAPLALITGLFAWLEAILPLKGGPLYITVYAVPLVLAYALAFRLLWALPY